mgnify:CR=1 FL=1
MSFGYGRNVNLQEFKGDLEVVLERRIICIDRGQNQYILTDENETFEIFFNEERQNIIVNDGYTSFDDIDDFLTELRKIVTCPDKLKEKYIKNIFGDANTMYNKPRTLVNDGFNSSNRINEPRTKVSNSTSGANNRPRTSVYNDSNRTPGGLRTGVNNGNSNSNGLKTGIGNSSYYGNYNRPKTLVKEQ